MDTLNGTLWSVLPKWGSEGWDAGSWPYIVFAVARTRDRNGELFGYGTDVEGDTTNHWFRSQDACFEAITAEVFYHWTSGQFEGPDNLPDTADRLPALRTGSPAPTGLYRGLTNTALLYSSSSKGAPPGLNVHPRRRERHRSPGAQAAVDIFRAPRASPR
ncbi:hypothetical protein ACSVHC_00470 [Arthrobacter sp. KNU-44]|uniref:hypothetical protein n=1 Tax=Arthrobacter sp. KNU-44 TaxID=3450744 RepID=UPI003F442B7B